MRKKWLVAKKVSREWQHQFPEINPVILQLLYNRGLKTQAEIDEFLNPDYGQDIHDPYLFQDMEKAVKRIFQAIENKEKIMVHGDYDADGVCASVMMVSTLQELGANVGIYIPHRITEGYGLNKKTVSELAKQGVNLIVTVDCGIANHAEVDLAQAKGMDVIVTDHHETLPELPKAFAIINPKVAGEKYPFQFLSGAGVAFKVAQALTNHKAIKPYSHKAVEPLSDGYEKWLLDLVALGTVADCVPLIGENRTLAKYGSVVLRKTRRLGLQELAKVAQISLAGADTYTIGFQIAPRLNAAGRLDHANTAFELLMTKDREEAKQIAENLNKKNQERQRTTEKMVQEAKEQIGEFDKDKKILIAQKQGWSAGLVGLVAGKLSDEFARPAMVIGLKKDEAVGSGRSIPEFDITQALIKCGNLLTRYGGHSQACGFELPVKNLEKFEAGMTKIASEQLKSEDLSKKTFIDTEIKLEQIDWPLLSLLESFEPFGEENPRSKFVAYGLEVVQLDKVGVDGKHLKLMVKHCKSNHCRKLIAFGIGNSWGDQLKIGDKIDIVFEVSVHEWNGQRELQLKVVDLKLATS